MLMTPERRHSERARIPCHIPVELTDAARAAQFEADAVDLSVGGLSLRAAQLPSIGSQLFCTFEAMPGGAQILGRGEVVWSQPAGEQGGGEFGLRFIEVDARNQALIDEMVAERIARITPREKPPEPVLATLEIENFDEPMTARLVHEGETHALFEQPLSHFAVGKAVIAHAGASLVRGHVASIEVRMEGTTPRLLINLEVARDASHFGEFMWGEPGSDTDPDVFAQTQAKADHGEAQQASADDDQDLEHESEDEDDLDEAGDEEEDEAGEEEEDEDGEDVPAALALHEDEAAKSGTLAGLGAPLPAPILARKDADAQQLPLFRRDTPRATTPELGSLHLDTSDAPSERPSYAPDDVYVDEQRAQQLIAAQQPPAPYDDDASLEEVHAVSLAASQQYAASEHDEDDTDSVPTDSPLMRVLGLFARLTEGVQSGKERAREWATGIREDAGSRVSGSGRLFGPKPRRVTSSIQREGDPGKHNLRVIAIGSLCILALVAFAYALTPSSDEPIPHHDVRGDQAGDPSGLEGDTETTEDTALAAASGDTAAPAHAEPAPAEKPAPARTAAPRANHVEHVEQASADKRAKPSAAVAKAPPPPAAAPSPAAVGSMSFGARHVPNARRFSLRMSEPVKTLLGKENADGFSVVIMGNTALDKAAPIAAGHPDVAHAAILNRRGDHSAELNVQFSPGKTPAYRVSGQGSTLEVLIEQ